MGKARPCFGLEEGRGKGGGGGRSGCRGCGSPLVKNRQLPKHRMTPALSFLKITTECTAVARPQAAPVCHSSAWPAHSLVPGLCLSLGTGSGPDSEGGSLFGGAPRMEQSDQPPLHLSWEGA